MTAQGSLFNNGPANYFRASTNPLDLAETTSQLFLGVRLTCAKCHHHPFEKYSQDDYYGFAAFFARVGTKPSREFGQFGGEQAVVVKSSGDVTPSAYRQDDAAHAAGRQSRSTTRSIAAFRWPNG